MSASQALTWVGILICISQSGMFSGLNLAFFSVSRLRLEIDAAGGDSGARQVLRLRAQSNRLLTTILWGNVGVNVLLTLLSNNVLAGVSAFIFSTVVITFVGEIIPQAYFSRHALKMAAVLMPIFRVYWYLLYPVSKPAALLLDWWLGPEAVRFFREQTLKELIRRHVEADEADIEAVEGKGAINFLDLDDLPVQRQGRAVNSESIVRIAMQGGKPVFPDCACDRTDPFVQRIDRSKNKWVILVDDQDHPQFVLDADGFLREALLGEAPINPLAFCHRPIVVADSEETLGQTLEKLLVYPEAPDDDVIDTDVILVWGRQRRIITGSDILGRLLRGIVRVVPAKGPAATRGGPS